jgi:ABC-type multidrug transport system fused ATPase/permease subunit
MKSVLSLFVKYLPDKRLLLALLALASLAAYLFFLGSGETRDLATAITQGKIETALAFAWRAVPIMIAAYGVSALLSLSMGRQCAGAASKMREELFKVFSWAPPLSVKPRLAEGGLTSRTSDLERAWTDGARPLFIALTNAISYLIMGAVIDKWAAACMAGFALLFTSLVELTLGKHRFKGQFVARNQQSAWDRWGRFLARPFGRRVLAMRDAEFEQARGQEYNQARLTETNKENTYKSLGDWAIQVGSLITYVATLLAYSLHQLAMHQSVTAGAVFVLVSATGLFQNTLNQGAQGLSTLRKGAVSVGHILEILQLRPLAEEAQRRTSALKEEAEQLNRQTGQQLCPSKTFTISDMRVSDSDGPLLDIPHLRIESGSWAFIVGPSGSGKSILLGQLTGRMHDNQAGHLDGGVSRAGAVICQGDAYNWHYLSASQIEGVGRWLSLAAPDQSDTVRTFLQSARADLLPKTKGEVVEKENMLLDALRLVGLLDVVKDRLDESLNGNILTKQQMLLLSLAQLSLRPAWVKSLIVLDESFSEARLNEDSKSLMKVIKVLREFSRLGSTIVVAEDAWDFIPPELFARSGGKGKSRNQSKQQFLELGGGTATEVSRPVLAAA